MRFWDTSAVIPLCVAEPATARVRPLAEADGALIVWWTTRTECLSALARRRRERRIGPAADKHARRVLHELAVTWSEVLPSEDLHRRSERLLAVHALRAADAFQLAAALLWSRGRTSGHALVCLDDRLREAAQREGVSLNQYINVALAGGVARSATMTKKTSGKLRLSGRARSSTASRAGARRSASAQG